MLAAGHAARITTRDERGRGAIEQAGAECWVGTPARLSSLRGSLDGVTIACWMLALARGTPDELAALHSSRLEFFLGQCIDTTVRGFVYDACPSSAASPSSAGGTGGGPTPENLDRGEALVRSLTRLNAIPAAVLRGSGGDDASGAGDAGVGDAAWLADAAGVVEALLAGDRSSASFV